MNGALTADAIKEIERLVIAARPQHFFARPGDPRHVVWRMTETGLVVEECEPEPLNVTLSTIEDMVNWCKNHDEVDEHSALFISDMCAMLVPNMTTRRYRITLHFKKSPELVLLETCAKKYDQKQFLRLLSIDLRRAITDTAVIANFRKLRWSAMKTVEGEISQTQESLGRSIVSQVHGSFPESLYLLVKPYENIEYSDAVLCAVDIIADEERFQLVPLAGAIDDMKRLAQRYIADQLKDCGCPMYFGSL